MVIREDYWNYCSRCDMIIDTDNMFEPTCSCISEIEGWSDEQFNEEYNSLPRHIRENFGPPKEQEANPHATQTQKEVDHRKNSKPIP